MSFGSIRDFTTWIWMVSRISDTSTGLSTFCRLRVSTILEFGGPRIRSTASFSDMPDHGLAVQRGDDVARLDAGARRGRVVDRRDDLDDALVLVDLDPQTAEFAPGLDLHVLERLGVHIGTVRIEPGEHAVDGVLDQVLVVDRIDIFRAHPLHDVAEHLQHLIHVGAAAVLGERTAQRPQTGPNSGAGEEGGPNQQTIAPRPAAEIHAFFPFGVTAQHRDA